MQIKPSYPWSCDFDPPVAPKVSKYRKLAGRQWQDEYSWLENLDDPNVVSYLAAENVYTQAITHKTVSFRSQLFEELKGRIQATDESFPVDIRGYRYFSQNLEGLQFAKHFRQVIGGQAEVELLLDENALNKNKEYFELGVLEVSENPDYLAYSIDTLGSEHYDLYIKELSTGVLIDACISDTHDVVGWSNQGDYLFYIKLNELGRPYKVFRHKLFTSIERDELIFEEADPAFSLSLWKSRSKRFIFVESHSGSSSEVWYLDPDAVLPIPNLIQKRTIDLEYTVDHQGERFLIITDDGVNNCKLMSTPLASPCRDHWQDLIITHGSVVECVEAFENQLVVLEQSVGQHGLRILDLKEESEYFLEFPQTENLVQICDNPDYQSRKLRYRYNSLITPDSIYEYDLDTKQRVLLKQQLIPELKNLSDYVCKRIYAQSVDGSEIPISLAYNAKCMNLDGNPVYLEGYGAYGESLDAEFDEDLFSLLNRGIIYAQAHVRGGGEMGKTWHQQGKLLKKNQSFSDFICCAEHLINHGIAASQKIVAYGASAGGLLVAASIKQRPDLFAAAICEAPFVDVLNTMANPELPLTVQDYDEFGDPADPKIFEYIKSYSPYETVCAGEYPPILITIALNDERVPYWEAVKWLAKLRTFNTSHTPMCLKVAKTSGHSGVSGRFNVCEDTAFIYDFVLTALGLNTAQSIALDKPQ